MNRKLENRDSAILLYNKLMVAIINRESLAQVSMLYSCYILATCGWNKSKAAKVLEVARRTLHRWQCANELAAAGSLLSTKR